MASKPLFNVLPSVSLLCLICQKEIKRKEKHRTNVDFSGKHRDRAKERKKLKIPENDRLASFPRVFDRISNINKGDLHEGCPLEFGTKLKITLTLRLLMKTNMNLSKVHQLIQLRRQNHVLDLILLVLHKLIKKIFVLFVLYIRKMKGHLV